MLKSMEKASRAYANSKDSAKHSPARPNATTTPKKKDTVLFALMLYVDTFTVYNVSVSGQGSPWSDCARARSLIRALPVRMS